MNEKLVEMIGDRPFIPYTINGILHKNGLRILQIINNAFINDSQYVGIIPGGSCAKGYFDPRCDSDIDLYFIGGDSTYVNDGIIQTRMNEIGEKEGIPIQKIGYAKSHSYFISNLSSTSAKSGWSAGVYPLLRQIIGNTKQIKILRKMARKCVTKSSNIQEKNFWDEQKRLVIYLLLWEDFGGIRSTNGFSNDICTINWSTFNPEIDKTVQKMLDRNFTRPQIDQIYQARGEMWKKRLEHLINGTGPFQNLR